MSQDDQELYWQLRVAATRITDEEARQLYLTAIAEVIRRVSTGKCFARSGPGEARAQRPPIFDDNLTARPISLPKPDPSGR